MKFSEHKKFSFALCLIQGFAGGVLGGFTYLIVSFREGTGTDLSLAIEIAPWFLLAGSILGSIKATVMWGFFRLIGRPLFSVCESCNLKPRIDVNCGVSRSLF